jgi:hypothetical protein
VRQVGGTAGIAPAVGAQLANQALGDNQRAQGDHPAGDAHLLQAGEVSLVELVCSVDSTRFCGFRIANFPDHHNVRILA